MNPVHQIIAIGVTVGIFLMIQMRRSFSIDLVFLGGLVIIAFTGVLTPREAVAGFANPAVITIGGLLAITAGLKRCGVLEWVGEKLLGDVHTEPKALRRLALSLVASSAFLINTALVAMIAPIVSKWCRRHRISPSRLLLPVSYLAILGGVCTLIGTTTNLVVNAKLQESYSVEVRNLELMQERHAGEEELTKQKALIESIRPMGMLEIGRAGFPCALVGALFMLLVGPRLLPDRTDLVEQVDDHRREYLVEMRVTSECPLVGKTVAEGKLRELPGLYLVEIDREDSILTPITPNEVIHVDDRLVFAGVVETIVDLEKIPGLERIDVDQVESELEERRERCLTEVVLSPSSPLIRSTLKRAHFRRRYNAAVVAIHRNGEKIRSKIGDVRLRSGDTLLLQTTEDFVARYRNNRDFYLVSAVEGGGSLSLKKMPIAAGIFIGLLVWLVVASFFGHTGQSWASPAIAVLFALTIMILVRCMRVNEARSAVDLQILVTIACALGLGLGLEKSGAALLIAETIISGVGNNPYFLMIMIYVTTVILTEMITNTAVAALMFPIALGMAQTAGVDARPFVMTICIAASLTFITPIGYQTNLMVMGPGGYQPRDYLRCGIPLSTCVGVTALFCIPFFWPF